MLRRVVVALVASAAGCLAVAAPTAGPGGAPAPVVGVGDGRQLVKDCRPWSPRGLSFFGRIAPAGKPLPPDVAAARDAFSRWTVDAVKDFGGDTMRLQVGLPFVDPKSPQFEAGYLDDVRGAVRMARAEGLVVILSLQWERRTGVEPIENTPQAAALRAWGRIAPAFAGDLGVAFELFNEPVGKPSPGPGQWEAWRAGHQAIVDDLRRRGVRNLLIVDGTNGARLLEGAPALHDPLGQLAYAVHPYFRNDLRTPQDWDARFGAFSRTHPVLVSEWSHTAAQCALADAGAVSAFVDWLAARRIGLIAFGADEPRGGRLLRSVRGRFGTTTYRGGACTGADAGPGEQVRRLFASLAEADRRVAAADPARCAQR
jgi:endoglucanase